MARQPVVRVTAPTAASPLHRVSAWACENRLVLAQEATDEKSNEITAIPKLLALLELKGCIVTLDAMGCQRAIAGQIKPQQGGYVMGLKGNQSNLHEAVEDCFTTARQHAFKAAPHTYVEEADKDHGPTATGSRKAFPPRQTWEPGQACAALAWRSGNAPRAGKPPSNNVSSSPPFPLMPNCSPKRYVSIGRLRTPCTGAWMSPCQKTKAVSAKATSLPW